MPTSAVNRLVLKLARINVKDYYRVMNGKRVKVTGYERTGKGAVATPSLRVTKAKKPDATSPHRVTKPPGAAAPHKIPPTPKPFAPKPAKPKAPTKASPKPAKKTIAEAPSIQKPGPFDPPEKPKFIPDAAKDLKGTGTKEDPYRTADVETAARLLGTNNWVQLDHERTVSTLLDRLAAIVAEASEKGEKAGQYDLCKVTVPGTNLFCVESKGIARIKMPQLGGIPTKGSKADALPRDSRGEVDLSEQFVKYVTEEIGLGLKESEVDAKFLKASQNELNGVKVAGIAGAIESGQFDPSRGTLFVSNDDYIVDGHHRWAAQVAVGIKSGKAQMIKTRVIDTDIITLLAHANRFAAENGIAQQGVANPKN